MTEIRTYTEAEWAAAEAEAGRKIGAAERDMAARWLPDQVAMDMAAAMLAAAPAAELVVVPLVQPGKQAGVWTVGQAVYTVRGAYFLADDDDGYGQARRLAVAVAEAELAARGQAGTVAYAIIERDGNAAVFEY
jgi:hypothetical protein